MELEQKQSLKQRLAQKAPKVIIAVLLVALLGLGGKLAMVFLEKQKVEQDLSTAQEEITRLKADLKNAADGKETAILNEKAACKALRTEDEERIAAFAKQAEKCIPIMKRFGIKN